MYDSHRTKDNNRSLHTLLRSARIYESEGISTTLNILQQGSEITVRSLQANLHIDEKDGQWEIYVPRNSEDQEFCYLHLLPERLAEVMGTTDLESKAAIAEVLNCGSLGTLEKLLQKRGVVKDPGLETGYEMHVEDDIWEFETASSSLRCTQVGRLVTPRTSRSSGYRSPSPSYSTPRSSYTSNTPRLSDSLNAPRSPNTSDGYRALLERVITTAATAAFPARGVFNFDELRNALLSGTQAEDSSSIFSSAATFGVRSQDQLSHDMKIGAAGELFVSH